MIYELNVERISRGNLTIDTEDFPTECAGWATLSPRELERELRWATEEMEHAVTWDDDDWEVTLREGR